MSFCLFSEFVFQDCPDRTAEEYRREETADDPDNDREGKVLDRRYAEEVERSNGCQRGKAGVKRTFNGLGYPSVNNFVVATFAFFMMFPDPVEDDNRGVDRISENRQNGRDKGQVDLDAPVDPLTSL